MSTRVATKRKLLSKMTLDNAVKVHITVFGGWEKRFKERPWHTDEYYMVRTYKDEPTGTIQLCAHGFIGRIHPNGRVTLDVGFNYFGELFDGQAKGQTIKQIQTNGVKMLHEAIKKSGLRN